MITVEDIKQRITSGIEGADVMVRLDGNKCLVAVASAAFEGQRCVGRQKAPRWAPIAALVLFATSYMGSAPTHKDDTWCR